MTDKDLISKLNTLKNVGPESSWLTSNRELFLAQISNSGGNSLSTGQVFFINLKSFLKASSQPVFALGVFVLVLVASSLFGHKLFSQAKPNDSLYIARIISEKAKLNTVLNPVEKNKLAVKFATNHAQDISEVLSDPTFNNEENKDQVAKLNDSFNKEIDSVKQMVNSRTTKTDKSNKTEVAHNDQNDQVEMSDEAISIAAEHKSEQGIQIKEAETNQTPVARATITTSTTVKEETKATTTEATTTELKVETEVDANTKITEADKMIDEAKDSFSHQDYSSVINKLHEVTEIIK